MLVNKVKNFEKYKSYKNQKPQQKPEWAEGFDILAAAYSAEGIVV